ncbi:MAG: ketopantoate reductase family protein [Solirubrobacteraceae bacterium]
MKLAVLGAGAIGAYVGAALQRGGSDVTLIARGAHLEAMRRHGVRVISPRGDFEAHPAATDDFDVLGETDVAFVALKAYSLPALAERIAAALGPETVVIPAQNGIPWWYFHSHPGPLAGTALDSVDPDGVISRSIEPERIVGCVVYCSTEIVSPGVIHHTEGTRFAIGEPDGSLSDRCGRISDAFVAGGLKCPVEERLRDQIWLKLIGNVAFNPVTALTKATLSELGSRSDMKEVLRAMLEESAAVAEALGVELPVSIERRLERGIAVGDHKTSTLQDLEAGKPLELDCMSGAVVELGDRLGIPVPHVRTVHACAKLLDALAQSRAQGQTAAVAA